MAHEPLANEIPQWRLLDEAVIIARKACEAEKKAWDTYDETVGAAWDAHTNTVHRARRIYDKAEKGAREIYEGRIATAREIYDNQLEIDIKMYEKAVGAARVAYGAVDNALNLFRRMDKKRIGDIQND